MALDITEIMKDGANRTIERNGMVLVGAFFVLSALSSLLGAGIARYAAIPEFVPGTGGTNALFVLPPVVAGVLSLVVGIASLVVSIAAIRVFVSEETDGLSRELFTRRMGWAALNTVVGAVVFGIVVGIGFVLLVVPGIFVLVTLAFWTVFVAVEDRNFVDGFRRSWRLTKGHRLRLLGLGIAVMLAGIVVNAVFGLGFAAGPTIGGLVAAVGSAVVSVFSAAVLAAAYTHLNAERTEDTFGGMEEPAPSTGGRGAI